MSLPEKIKNTAPSKSSYPQLSESDKDFIREYISKSGSEEEKKERRKECSDQF
jgi:hypothetical protein